jgi:hypothetical protein
MRQTLKIPWRKFWENIEKTFKKLEKTLEIFHGKILGNPWENTGKTLQTSREMVKIFRPI